MTYNGFVKKDGFWSESMEAGYIGTTVFQKSNKQWRIDAMPEAGSFKTAYEAIDYYQSAPVDYSYI